MSALKNHTKSNNSKGRGISDTRKDPGSNKAKDDSTQESEGKDPLAFSKEEAVSGVEEKQSTPVKEDRNEANEKSKTSTAAKQKDVKSTEKKHDSSAKAKDKEDGAGNNDASSSKIGSSPEKEEAKSLMESNESREGPKDLFYIFQKYANREESTKGNESITLTLLKKWLKQSGLLDEESDITETYIEDLFEKSISGTDTIDFEEFQTFLYNLAEEKKVNYSELMHKLLIAGKPDDEIAEKEEELLRTVEDSLDKQAHAK